MTNLTNAPVVLDRLRLLLQPRELAGFLAVYAGQQLRFPKRPVPSRQLVRIVGLDAARGLAERFRGETVYIPLDAARQRRERDTEICARAATGEPLTMIARTFVTTHRISVSRVRRIVAAGTKRGPPR